MKCVSESKHYASVTTMDKFQVETVVGFTVRTAYLEEDWHTLAGMIRYPIIIKGTELNDADAFLEYMTDKTISESARDAMLEEDFLDMVVNEQGILMGGGAILLGDPNFGAKVEPELEIIAMNGIIDSSK